jgi:hypothetical protein
MNLIETGYYINEIKQGTCLFHYVLFYVHYVKSHVN